MGKLYLRAACAVLTVLLAWGGIGGAYAQETTTLLEYGTSDVAWSTTNLANWTAGGTPTISTDGSYVEITGGNGSYATSTTIAPTENAVLNVTAVWRGRSNTGRAYAKGNGSYFRFGNIVVAQNDQDQKHGYVLTGLDNIAQVTTFKAGSYRTDIGNLPFLLIEATINTASNTLTSFSVKSEDGNTTYASIKESVVLTDPDYTTVAFGYRKSGSVKTSNAEDLKSIKITQTTQAVQNADYTFNYKLGDTTVKTVTGSMVVDNTVTGETAITGDDGVKYLVVADDVPSIFVTSDATENVLDVPVRKPYTATLKVTTIINGESTTEETSLTETDAKECSWTYAYPLYKKSGDVYYKVDNTESFGETGTFTDGETISKTVNYSTADNDIVFFGDPESAAGANLSYSNGATGASTNYSLGSFVAGSYQLTVNVTAQGSRRSIYVRDATNSDNAANAVVVVSKDGLSDALFTLSEGKSLFISGYTHDDGKVNQSADFDYVIIKKVAAPTLTIGSASLASYSNASAVTVPEDVVIYKATEPADGVVTLTRVDGQVIPAGTGVFLYSATTGEKTLSYGGTSTADFTDNALKGTGSGSYTVADGEMVYALVADKQAVAKVNAGVAIPANKAYLPVKATDAAKQLRIVLDSETTGINEVKGAEESANNQDAYNLAGQRVGKAYKGVTVKNGRKYIAK